ncbi:MAG: hypothetical protein IJB96_11235, partial [Lachnospira sp.]|nr:hypothetical protein [Lachnospira sp.]
MRRLSALIMALCLFVSVVTNGGNVVLYASEGDNNNQGVVEISPNTDGVEKEPELERFYYVEDGEPSKYGYQAMKFVDSEGNDTEINSGFVGPVNVKGTLPAAYKSPYITGIRSQSPYGTCWAHTAMACIEAGMIKKGLVTDDMINPQTGDLNLSEKHLIWFAKGATVPDEESYLYGEGGGLGWDALESGGNYDDAYFALSKWWGVEQEANFPYSDFTDGLAEAARYNSYGHLQDMYIISPEEREAAKQAVLDYGAVFTSYYSTDSYYKSVEYNGAYTYSYRYPSKALTNHAVTIVGWDDNYPKENFKSQPTADGAWICKNSWGDWWGVDGYFYISYEDATIYDYVAFNIESADNYDNNYQYDGETSGGIASSSELYGVNVFTAAGNEKLKAVGFYSQIGCVDYTVKVFKNFTALDENTGQSGSSEYIDDAVAAVTGSEVYPGYHTVELEEPVTLQAGEKYAVAVSLKYYDTDKSRYMYLVQFDGYSDDVGKSFYSYVDGASKDLISYEANVCIKAFTDNAVSYDVSVDNIAVKDGTVEYNGTSENFEGKVALPICGKSEINGITVVSGVTAELMLDNVDIANLTVDGQVTIYVGGECNIGNIIVNEGGSLTIKGNGKLVAGKISGNADVSNIFLCINELNGELSKNDCMVKYKDVYNVYGSYKLVSDLTVAENEKLVLSENTLLYTGSAKIKNSGIIDIAVNANIYKLGLTEASVGTEIVNTGSVNRYFAAEYLFNYDKGGQGYNSIKTVINDDNVVFTYDNGEYHIYGINEEYNLMLHVNNLSDAVNTPLVEVNKKDVLLDAYCISIGKLVANVDMVLKADDSRFNTIETAKDVVLGINGSESVTAKEFSGLGSITLIDDSTSLEVSVEEVNCSLRIETGSVDIGKLGADIDVVGGSIKIADAGSYKVYDGNGGEAVYKRMAPNSSAYIRYENGTQRYALPYAHVTDKEYLHLWLPKNVDISFSENMIETVCRYGVNSKGVEKWLKVVDKNFFKIKENGTAYGYEYNGKLQRLE